MRRRNDSVEYEKVTRAIFQTLVDQDEASNTSVEHNIKLQGKFLSHQIDVYWKFKSAGIEHSTVIECKNWNKRLKQESLLAFRAKLEDLSVNHPTGVMVTRGGFQSGAVKYAKAHGILLYELFEAPPRPPLVVKEGSFGTIELKFDQARKGMPPRIIGIWTYFELKYENTEYYLDPQWFEAQTKHLPPQAKEEIKNLKIEMRPALIKLYDDKSIEIGNVLKLYMEKSGEMHKLKVASDRLVHHFGSPTFIATYNALLPYVKINSIVADLGIIQHEPIEREMKTVGFVDFILRNLQDGTDKTVSIEERRTKE